MPYGLLFRLFRALYPLIKEGLFGKENVSDVARRNKVATSWIIAALICFGSSLFLAADLFRVNDMYVALNAKYQAEHSRLILFSVALGQDPLTGEIPANLVDKVTLDALQTEYDTYKQAHPIVSCQYTGKLPVKAPINHHLLDDLKGYWP